MLRPAVLLVAPLLLVTACGDGGGGREEAVDACVESTDQSEPVCECLVDSIDLTADEIRRLEEVGDPAGAEEILGRDRVQEFLGAAPECNTGAAEGGDEITTTVAEGTTTTTG